jgi:ATP-dependent 26S proteasome regulatory subunit
MALAGVALVQPSAATTTTGEGPDVSMPAYQTSREHILAELERVDLLVQLQVWRARQLHSNDEELRGLYLSEPEVDALLARPLGMPRWAAAPLPAPPEKLQTALDYLGETIDQARAETQRQPLTLRLDHLAQRFQLTAFDVDALLICLAPEIDSRYEALYAYLQDDLTKKRPSVELVLNLLCPTLEAKLEMRQRFGPSAPLSKYHLLSVFDDPTHLPSPLLNKYLKVDERLIAYLLDGDEIEARLLPYARLLQPQAELGALLLPAELKERLRKLIKSRFEVARGLNRSPTARTRLAPESTDGLRFYFRGPSGVGKRTVAEALCRAWQMRLLVIEGGQLVHARSETFETLASLAVREALLQNAALYWEDFDALFAEDKSEIRAALTRAVGGALELAGDACPLFLAGESRWEPLAMLRDWPLVSVEFTRPGYADRRQLWESALDVKASESDPLDLAAVAGKFRFSAGQIFDAAQAARNLARWRDPEKTTVTAQDIQAACRLQSNPKLNTLARKLTPHYTWSDIVLPSGRLEQLREICNFVKYRALVYGEWGFDGKLALGKGLNVLFAGPSGTGKTMAAEIMAGELALDLYKIDLATVVSKYIGETEKNLSRIFAEAETSNSLLFFDEADALFGKRSEVNDAHDRYANLEISYLLQRMEEYEGIVILATNFRKNMDEAFVRRMHATVEFPFPDEQDRRRIWENIWPAETPRGPKLDLDFMAQRFELTGGNIRNVALAAAFLAADDGREITMNHLLHATQREYQKMGKVAAEMEFQRYTERRAAKPGSKTKS